MPRPSQGLQQKFFLGSRNVVSSNGFQVATRQAVRVVLLSALLFAACKRLSSRVAKIIMPLKKGSRAAPVSGAAFVFGGRKVL
jgi:hypothetical protein